MCPGDLFNYDFRLTEMRDAAIFASAQPGVTATLVGMRAPKYVLEMTALLRGS